MQDRRKGKFKASLRETVERFGTFIKDRGGTNFVISCNLKQPFGEYDGSDTADTLYYYIHGIQRGEIPVEQLGKRFLEMEGAGRLDVDAGVAVSWKENGKTKVYACDRWLRVRDNLSAILNTLEAAHFIEYWGVPNILEKSQ